METLVPDFDDLVDGNVQEIAVVRDQHEGVWIVLQILFQPVARFEIEMVGGLVEQQQVRFLQQEFGQRDAHLPTAGELLCAPLPVIFAKAKAHENRADLRFDGIAVASAEFMFDALVAIRDRGIFGTGVVEFRHAVGEGLQFLLHRAHVVKDRHALGENSAARKSQAVLRKISGAKFPWRW